MSRALDTVLVISEASDTTADRVEQVVRANGVSVLRFDTADFPQRLRLDATPVDGHWHGSLVTSDGAVRLDDVMAIYLRRPTFFEFPAHLTVTERWHAGLEARYGLGGILTSLSARWCNPLAASADAAYKPSQLVLFEQCGLTVPRTLITNFPDAVKRFTAEVGQIVCKALMVGLVRTPNESFALYTRLLTDDDLADLRGVDYSAHLFQKFLEKAYEVRLMVVADTCFAVRINAASDRSYIDWRSDYAMLSYEIIDTPPDVRAGVLAYMRRTGLVFGAFDFVVQPDHSWVVLECNPEGQWGWLADETGLPIAEAIAMYLTKGIPGS